MTLIEDKSDQELINSLNFKNDKNFQNSQNILIFGVTNQEIANKWLCVINYFISK